MNDSDFSFLRTSTHLAHAFNGGNNAAVTGEEMSGKSSGGTSIAVTTGHKSICQATTGVSIVLFFVLSLSCTRDTCSHSHSFVLEKDGIG